MNLKVALAIAFALLACISLGQSSAQSPNPKPTPEIQELLQEARSTATKDRLPILEAALARAREVMDRPGEAQALLDMGEAQRLLGQGQNALEIFEKALVIWREIGDRAGESTVLGNMGIVYGNLGQNPKALEYYQKALVIQREIGSRVGEGNLLGNLGIVYGRLGQNQKALEHYEKALVIDREFGDRRGEGVTLNNMGNIYGRLGRQQKALECYEKALVIRREVGDRRGEGSTLSNIGTTYWEIGQNQKALEYHNMALAIRREVGDRRGEGVTLSNIAVVFWQLGQNQKALDYYGKALVIRREVGDRLGEGITLSGIGIIHEQLGQNQKALEYYEKALLIATEVEDRRGVCIALNKIGTVYRRLGQNHKTLEYYEKALTVHREVGDRRTEGVTLSSIGAVHQQLGQSAETLEYYGKALARHREVGGRSHEQGVLSSMRGLFASSHPNLAVFFGKTSVNVSQGLRKDSSGLSKELRDSFAETVADSYRNLADLLVSQGRLPEAEHALRLLKDEELLEFVRRTDDSLGGLMAYTPTESKWNKEYEIHLRNLADLGGREQSLLVVKERTTEQEAELTTIQEKFREAEDAFKKFIDRIQAESKSGGAESPTAVKGYKSIQSTLSALPKGTVAVYTIVSPSSLRLVFLTPNKAQARTVTVSSSELSKRIQGFRKSLQNRLPDVKKQGLTLYQLLIKPIEQDLKQYKAQDIMWSLDGPLRYIPIGALWDGKNYAIEKYGISIFNPSASDRLLNRPGTKNHALAAGVSIARKIVEEDGTEHRFQPLAGVSKELASVATTFKKTQQLLDSNFTLKNFSRELEKQPHLVHLATHFVFRAGDESKSFLLTGQGPVLGVAEARKIGSVALKNVSLLTLSACETGLGASYGDGSEVESIAVIFQRKGAGALLATLWPVADTSTQPLIAEFYREWSANAKAGKSSALRKAQIAMLRGQVNVNSKNGKLSRTNRFAHPFYWAPFVLSGNSR